MRWLVLLVAACSSPAKPKPQPPLANTSRACVEAATGLERATKGLRAPEQSVLEPMRRRCEEDAWPNDARECFTNMQEGELGRCAKLLLDAPRNAMLNELGGGFGPRTRIAAARARLETLQVGVAECDRFIVAVATVLTCEGMELETRANLGTETADFWSLPTTGLPADVQARMSAACGESLSSLRQQAATLGCVL